MTLLSVHNVGCSGYEEYESDILINPQHICAAHEIIGAYRRTKARLYEVSFANNDRIYLTPQEFQKILRYVRDSEK